MLERVVVDNFPLTDGIRDDVIVGKAFAFIDKKAFQHPALSWVKQLVPASARDRGVVIPLAGRDRIGLPGVSFDALRLAPMQLRAITTDKPLYREGKDAVRVLVVHPLLAGDVVGIEIVLDGVVFAKRRITLGASGASMLTLDQLPVGQYKLRFDDAVDASAEPPCEFMIAEYRLAPLVASLGAHRFEGGELGARIRLEVYGVPFDGEVDVDLTERGNRGARQRVMARAGDADVQFKLTGDGPHALQIQLVRDPSRTATVPIVGSRASERKLTVLSALGIEVHGSLLPAEGSTEVSGIHFTEGAMRTTPVRLERVDARRARFTFATDAASVHAIVFDPSIPRARASAVDVKTAPHPATNDPGYVEAEAAFNAGRFADALTMFMVVRAERMPAPHPNYAYYIACCYARLGNTSAALALLRNALMDGWTDFNHLEKDEDLASLRPHPDFQAIVGGGAREFDLGDVASGAVIEIDVPHPMAIIALGAYVGSQPWEGWAAVIAPSTVATSIEAPATCKPSDVVRIDINATNVSNDAAAYVIVKDARLLSADTPKSRLAGSIKSWIQTSGDRLFVGHPTIKLRTVLPPPPQPLPPPFAMMPSFGGGPVGGPPPSPRGSMRSRSAPAAGMGAPMMSYDSERTALGGAPLPRPQMQGAPSLDGASPYRDGSAAAAAAGAPPPPALAHEPEVVFAGLVDIRGGRGTVFASLGDGFADYVIEAFVVSGLEWSSSETRFRAESLPLAALELPAFVHAADYGSGRAQIGSRSGEAMVTLTRNGAPVPLWVNGRMLEPNEPVRGLRADVAFAAGPGEYQLSVRDLQSGETANVLKLVEEPGKIRRISRALKLLQANEQLRRSDDASILSLRALPSLDKPFRALVDATSDYGHACCEQTAAKMLAAVAMYVLTPASDHARRARAVSILEAGIRREQGMWLRGRGFKMYPESSSTPDEYWGPKAATYLFELAILRPYKDLNAIVEAGLEMASDTARAYKMPWPPTNPQSCEQAYKVLIHDKRPEARAQAFEVVRQRIANGAPPTPPRYGGAVALRVEAAYAASALLLAGPQEMGRALALANIVVKDLGDEGRLYSTVDSVAAIALMSELVNAGVVNTSGGSTAVEIDGRAIDAAQLPMDANEIWCRRGVVPVEVTRIVEERWDAYGSGVDMRVALEKNGRVIRRLQPGDSVDLKVSLPGGYKTGDVLWVCLPDALSYLRGGGQVKRFSIDFAENNEVVVPLAATATTPDGRGGFAAQKWAAAVRNMFEEERVGSPGLIDVIVQP